MMGTDPNQLHSDPNLLLGSLQGQGQDPGRTDCMKFGEATFCGEDS
jgi:hypothetical protein